MDNEDTNANGLSNNEYSSNWNDNCVYNLQIQGKEEIKCKERLVIGKFFWRWLLCY